jgi:hypothetical protein
MNYRTTVVMLWFGVVFGGALIGCGTPSAAKEQKLLLCEFLYPHQCEPS